MKKVFILFIPCIIFFTYSSFSQNVGIGTTATRAKFEVYGAVGTTSAIFGGESSGISLQRNLPAIGFNEYFSTVSKNMANGYAAKILFDPTDGNLAIDMFGNGVSNANTIYSARPLTIANNGNMGIRASPISASLYVLKAGNYEGSAVFGGTNYNSHFHYGTLEDTYIRGGRPNSNVYINDISGGKIIMGNGNALVGINNGVPVFPLEIRQANGRGILLVEPNNNFNNWELRLSESVSNLNLLYNGQFKGFFNHLTGNYIVYSDRRLKTGIEGMQTMLTKIMQLEPVEYEMTHHNTNHEKTIGFIAQDVNRLFPELVSVSTDTSRGYPGVADLHGLNYNGFVVVTIKALQEQQQLIKKMQEQNKEITKRILIAEASRSVKNK